MISKKAKIKIAELLESMVKTAEITVDGKTEQISILRTEIDREGDTLKVYTKSDRGDGLVTNICIRDAEGDIVLEQPKNVVKNTAFGLISTFWIKIGEREIEDPISIFELGGDRQ